MIVDREADRGEGSSIDESQAVRVVALYGILEQSFQFKVSCRME